MPQQHSTVPAFTEGILAVEYAGEHTSSEVSKLQLAFTLQAKYSMPSVLTEQCTKINFSFVD